MAPHIAVPEAINIPKLLSILNRFARNKPIKKIINTKTDIYGKYLRAISVALDADIVRPIKIIPTCKRFVVTDLLI